mgnify:CR=1 FL=1
MAGNGGIIGPTNTVSDVYKDKLTTFTSSGTFNKSTTKVRSGLSKVSFFLLLFYFIGPGNLPGN